MFAKKTLTALLAVLPLMLTVAGCDVENDVDADMLDEAEIAERVGLVPGPLYQPYYGRWQGVMENVGGSSLLEYDATIKLAPPLCTASGAQVYTAEWDYYNLGEVCTSELSLLGVGVNFDGTRTWTFYDTNLTGPCTDGLVDLTETADPTVMEHTWRYPDGTLDAQGTLDRTRSCFPLH